MARRRPSNKTGEANVSPFLVMLCAFLALGIALYPLVSNAYNERHRSQIQTAYTAYVEELDTAETDAEREAAEAYNTALVPGVAFTREALQRASEQYDGILNVRGDGTMGYLEIPKLGVELPILHGPEEESLSRGVGHLLGTSLPVGGENTHCVLTGHSGMASQRMFSDLDQLEAGDLFYLNILGEILAYEVDAIHVVLPEDTAYLQIEPGEDYCTLVTCTPYGVNSHRLLVRGHRIPYEQPEAAVQEQEALPVTESTWLRQYGKGIRLGLLFLAVPLLLVLTGWIRRKWQGHRLFGGRGGKFAKKKK